MLHLKAIYLGCVAALGLAISADRAMADPWIQMTSCEQTVVSGTPLSHVQFSVQNAGSTALYTVYMRTPDPNAPLDSCHTVTLDSPPSWPGVRRPDGGAEWNTTFGTNTQIEVGGTLGGFGATLSGTQCCFQIIFINAFGEPTGGTHFCFHCDLPSATVLRTWGYMKSIYR